MLILLAQAAQQVGSNGLDILGQAPVISPIANIGRLIEIGADFVLLIGTLALLVMLLMGAFNWVTAGGDKGKIESARDRMTQAVIGIVVLASVFAIYSIILNFFGLQSRINLGGTGGGGTTQTGQLGAPGSPQGCAVGTVATQGGSGYCSGGTGRFTCVASGTSTTYVISCCVSGTVTPGISMCN